MNTEPLKLRITVDDRNVVIILPKATDVFLIPWQDAKRIIKCLDGCIRYLAPDAIETVEPEQVQVRQEGNGVAVLFPWATKLELSFTAAKRFKSALMTAIRDAQQADFRIVKEMHTPKW